MVEKVIRVLCVDDNPAIAGLFHLAIQLEPDMESLGSLRRADDLLAEVERSHPDVVLLDLMMPGKDPLLALKEVSDSYPDTKTIVFSGYSDTDSIDKAVQAGARGYIFKTREMEDVLTAIRHVAQGGLALGSD